MPGVPRSLSAHRRVEPGFATSGLDDLEQTMSLCLRFHIYDKVNLLHRVAVEIKLDHGKHLQQCQQVLSTT